MSFLEATASELSLVKGEMLIQTIEFVVCNKAVKKIHGLLYMCLIVMKDYRKCGIRTIHML